MQNKEDALQFMQERLRQQHQPPMGRAITLRSRPRVLRRFAFDLERGELRVFEDVDENVRLHCARGSLWVTHDGDPKDLILRAGQVYQAERETPMRLFAIERCLVEIEFEDEQLLDA